MSGGLARNAGMINQLRETERNVVLVDCGDFVSDRDYGRELIAEVTLKGMKEMKYDAIALGPQDLLLSRGSLKSLLSGVNLPVVASNLVDPETGKPFQKGYVLFERGSVRVGVIAVISQISQEERDEERNPFLKEEGAVEPPPVKETVAKTLRTGDFKILSMDESVAQAVREIRDKVDILILMSQGGFDETCDLVDKIPGIDLAVSAGEGNNTPGKGSLKTPVLTAPNHGTSLGYVRFDVEAGKVVLKQKKMIGLSCSSGTADIPEDKAVAALIGDDFERKLGELMRERSRQQEAEVLKEAKELWKLSPREFLEMEAKKKAGKNDTAGNPFGR